MKKFLVLFALFIVPIVAYLFFASGINNFAKLPVITEKVNNVEGWKSLSGEPVSFNQKITVLGFIGSHPESNKLMVFNIHEKIYKRFYGFQDFQMVMVLPEGKEAEAENLRNQIGMLSDVGKWRFVFAPEDTINSLFSSLQTTYRLDSNLGSSYVFIIDKNEALRGRKDNSGTEIVYGYDAASVAEIQNKMLDDVKVILAEYRLALKKYNSNRQK